MRFLFAFRGIFVKRFAMLFHLVAWICFAVLSDAKVADEHKGCTFPGTPWHGRITDSKQSFKHNDIVRYACDPGYTLIGMETQACRDGKWDSHTPECLREMALDKPAQLSSETAHTKASFAVDGTKETCAQSKPGDDKPMWAVDIIEPSRIKFIHMVFGAHAPNVTIEVRVGNHFPSTGAAFNGLCKRQVVDIFPAAHFYFHCPDHLLGRHVSLQVLSPGHEISLCDVHVYSTSSLAVEDACLELKDDHPEGVRQTFAGRCIEVLKTPIATLDVAAATCRRLGGRLLEQVDKNLQEFVNWQTKRIFKDKKDVSLWLAAERVKNKSSPTGWRWLSGLPVTDVQISESGFGGDGISGSNDDDDEDADISGVGDENSAASNSGASDCLVIQGAAWRSKPCDRTYHAACVYDPATCGTPPLPERAASWKFKGKVLINSTAGVHCDNDFYLDGDEIRCHANGSLSQTSPVCLPLGCNMDLENGTISFVGASNLAKFTCNKDFILESSGGSELRCVNGQWSSMTPLCLEDSQSSRLLHDALAEVHEVKHFLSGLPLLSELSSSPHLELVIGIAALAVLLLMCVFVGLGCFIMARRRRLAAVKVTVSQHRTDTGAAP